VKRLLDLIVVLFIAPLAVPITFVVALLIRLETRGHPLFRQTRIGLGGQPFVIYKLRTMIDGAEHIGAGIYAEPGDTRFTRIGNFARRYSLDELPQLVNVLKGEMSIVGPRPMLPITVEEYGVDYEIILQAKPGITGLAQVSGRNALTRRERLELDKQYVRSRALLLDLAILLRTVRVAFSGEGQLNTQRRSDVER
jgi:lipopolysaccharide/colanic/teichoic acid biosynthesis glycosyltransferase